MLRTRANASAYIFEIGKAKTKILVEGPSAAVRLDAKDPGRFIIRAVDNLTDPMSIVSIFKFKATSKRRMAELASASTFGSIKANKLDYLSFTGEKYGESSYLITLDEMPSGEYGIMVKNPNNLDQKSAIVSTFVID